jgi:hypothetical protein
MTSASKETFIDYATWFVQNCKTSIGEIIIVTNQDMLKDEQDMFYTDSSSDMEKLYQYYKESHDED